MIKVYAASYEPAIQCNAHANVTGEFKNPKMKEKQKEEEKPDKIKKEEENAAKAVDVKD